MMDHNSSCISGTFQVKLLPPMYGVEFCVALVGNLFALRLLATRERNWHTGVVLSCNLAISDLLYVLTLPLLIVYYKQDNWLFGIAVCKIERFLFTCNLYGSIYFIMCISLNRYVAIVHPFFARNHLNPAKAKAASVIVWVFVTTISSPVLKFASTCTDGSNQTHCVSYSYCTNSQASVAYSHLFYKMVLSGVGCFIPFLVTFASYCAVLRVVWKNANITSLEKRKVALMVFAVVVLYAISFVPYHFLQSYYLYRKVHKLGTFCDLVYKAYQVSKGLATLNMCIHPLLYMAVFDSIRVACCGRSSADKAMNNT